MEPQDRDEKSHQSVDLPRVRHQLGGRVSSDQLLSLHGLGLRSGSRGQTYSGGRA